MKTTGIVYSLLFVVVLTLVACSDKEQEAEKLTADYYIAIEINNVLCGYSGISMTDSIVEGETVRLLRQNTWFNFEAMGKIINQHQRFTYLIDISTGNFIYHDSFIKQGKMEMGGVMYVEDGKVRVTSRDSREDTLMLLPENVILPNTQLFPHLASDFGTGKLTKKTYTIFDVRTSNITKFQYTRIGEEQLKLAGNLYDAVILIESDPVTGLETKMWIDKKSAVRLKTESQNHLKMYLTDASVMKKAKTGSWDDVALIKTNRFIKDIHKISFMKVKAGFEPVPAVSGKDINIPGQKFAGRINGNKVEGIFEISCDEYNGDDAPLFPPDTTRFGESRTWLRAEERIESDDPVLISKAREIAAGSDDIWEASCRIGRWVAENINGALEGGPAKETFDRRWGNCASQSLLMAALCRAAGIPARVVWGCIYTPEKGGSFGHHAWNEVYMGKAGWIPVDVTLNEPDYANAGHLRLGVLHTWQTVINFGEMEILEFRVRE